MRLIISVLAFAVFTMSVAEAKVVTETIEYEHNGVTCEGYLAYVESDVAKRPGVLVVHQWKGLGDFEKDYCNRLAELGYVAFAADVYGKGVRPETTEEAGAQATIYRSDRALMRSRVQAGLDVLKAHSRVDESRTAAMGFCFGGGCVLELARSGADVNGVVSFHGNLDTPDPGDAQDIKGSVLVLHGADDPYVPQEHIRAFEDEMRNAGVDWQFVAYGNAVHAFTDYHLGTDNSSGAAYNELAARRSWEAMVEFLAEMF